MKFTERLAGMLVKPGETMKDIIKEPRIEEALVIVGIYAIFVMISTYVAASHIKYTYEIPGMEAAGAIQTFTTIFTLVMGLVMPLIGWPIAAGILHLFSMAFGGTGKFYPPIMTAIGYTDLVKIFAVIISIVLMTQAPVVSMVISSSSLTGVQSMLSELYTNPFYIASNIVMLLGLIWSCYQGALAIKEGEKLTMTQALIVVGVPLIIYIAFSYGTMLLGLI